MEGPTDDLDVIALREKQKRNFLATLFLSQGVPMLAARRRDGPHAARQQQRLLPGQRAVLGRLGRRPRALALLEFTEQVAQLRREHPVFRRRRFFQGVPVRGSGRVADIVWFTPAGVEMSDDDWEAGFARSVMVFLNGKAIPTPDPRGEAIVDDSFLLLLNAHHEDLAFTLPAERFGERWEWSSTRPRRILEDASAGKPGTELDIEARSMLVLRGL